MEDDSKKTSNIIKEIRKEKADISKENDADIISDADRTIAYLYEIFLEEFRYFFGYNGRSLEEFLETCDGRLIILGTGVKKILWKSVV